MRIQVIRETHDTPVEIQDRIARVGGYNLFGQPNYRVVWGGSRLTWIWGKWANFDDSGNETGAVIEARYVPKYIPIDRWYLEKWLPPSLYGTPEQWGAKTTETEDGIRGLALGPYPSRGEYEHAFTLESTEGEFIALDTFAVDTIVAAIQISKGMRSGEKKSAIYRNWNEQQDEVNHAMNEALEMTDEEGDLERLGTPLGVDRI